MYNPSVLPSPPCAARPSWEGGRGGSEEAILVSVGKMESGAQHVPEVKYGGRGGWAGCRSSAVLGEGKAVGAELGAPGMLPAPRQVQEKEEGFSTKPFFFSPKETPHFLTHPSGCSTQPPLRLPSAPTMAHGTPSPSIPFPCLHSPPRIFSLFLNNPRRATSCGWGEHHELPRAGLGTRAGHSTGGRGASPCLPLGKRPWAGGPSPPDASPCLSASPPSHLRRSL